MKEINTDTKMSVLIANITVLSMAKVLCYTEKLSLMYNLIFLTVGSNPLPYRISAIALRTAKSLWNFGRSECNRVNHKRLVLHRFF